MKKRVVKERVERWIEGKEELRGEEGREEKRGRRVSLRKTGEGRKKGTEKKAEIKRVVKGEIREVIKIKANTQTTNTWRIFRNIDEF